MESKKMQKANYGWYHTSMIFKFGPIGCIGIIALIFGFINSGFLAILLIIGGLLGIIFFLWPVLGIIFVNIYTKTGKTHPTASAEEINAIKNPKILDIGCGSGRVSIKLAKLLSNGGHVYGIDIFNNAIKGNSIEKALKNAELESVSDRTTILYGSVAEIPFEDKIFDIINMSYVMHEVPDKSKALKEIKRVLKPDGILILTEFHRNSFIAILINGIYSIFFKNIKYWFNLLEENEFETIIYQRKLGIGTFFVQV